MGSSSLNSPEIIDFVMPGNGLPVATDSGWKYVTGTSCSTPYLAAAILIGIYGYNLGYQSIAGVYKDPSVSNVYDILKISSSRISCDKKYQRGLYRFEHNVYTGIQSRSS